jgi:hypothetical protein
MQPSIWQFSIGGLLIFTAFVAGVVAFAANFPTLAFLVACGAAWAMLESGVMFHIQTGEDLSKPSAYTRHPFLIAGASVYAGVAALTFSVGCCYMLWSSPNPNWLGLIPVALFGTLGVFSLRPIWLLIKYSQVADDSPASNE